MRQTVVFINGTNAGPWALQNIADDFTARGWACHLPTLRHHEEGGKEPDPGLLGLSIEDYTGDLAQFVRGLDEPPVLVGHSMGGVIAQKLAAQGLARAIILLNSSILHGILPTTEDERSVAMRLMAGGAFWETILELDFPLMSEFALNAMEPELQHAVFDRLGPESGRVFFELFFWMFDERRATSIDFDKVTCPVLVATGAKDRGVSSATARQIAARYGERATLYEVSGMGHYMMLEPGWQELAAYCADWIETHVPAG